MDSKKVKNLISLNIKIDRDLNRKLKRARELAREKKEMFNVSEKVSEFLLNELNKFEEENGIKEEITNPNQINLFE